MQNYGYDANDILLSACETLEIKSVRQSYQLMNKNTQTESNGLLVFIDDEKYNFKVFGFSDVCLDSFVSGNGLSFNSFLVPLKKIDSLKICVGGEDFRFFPTERMGLFFSNNENNYDICDFSVSFGLDKQELLEAKNSEIFDDVQFGELMQNVSRVTGFDLSGIESAKNKTKTSFFACKNSESEARKSLKETAIELLNMTIVKDKQNSTFDCATFIMFLFMSELGVDITKGGFGSSLTGKIMSGKLGENCLIDENMSVEEKREFVLKNAKIGDVLLFHRQSKSADKVEEDNWFPGHVGIYVGDGKYIDARHRRGDVRLVDMNDDPYMECFIGFKDVVSACFNEFGKQQNEKCSMFK